MTHFSLRKRNTDSRGGGFSYFHRIQVWKKAAAIPGYSPDLVRRDQCGAIMKFSDYGVTDSEYGWEIDHINPVANGGSDDITNLQPLHWKNNRQKSDSVGNWQCAIGGA